MEVGAGALSEMCYQKLKSAQRAVGELDQEMHLWRAADVKRGNLELTDASRKGGSCKEIRPKNSNLRAAAGCGKEEDQPSDVSWLGLIFGNISILDPDLYRTACFLLARIQ